jgi:hypothetical protein
MRGNKSSTPRPFGFPAWTGVKRRIAKKLIGGPMLERYVLLRDLRVGDLVSTCSGLNARVTEAEPEYILTRHGTALWDIRFQTTTGGCSLRHCGVGPALTYEEALAARDYIIRVWKNNDIYGFAERYAKRIINLDGTYRDPEE